MEHTGVVGAYVVRVREGVEGVCVGGPGGEGGDGHRYGHGGQRRGRGWRK